MISVSVPLRGKEGEGHYSAVYIQLWPVMFPSPCGVRRVKDRKLAAACQKRFDGSLFPSPCGVRRVKDFTLVDGKLVRS